MNRTAQFVIGLLAVLLAIIAGVYGRNVYLKEVSTYQIPVPVTDIPPYTVLNESMFQMRDMPRTMEALPYYQSLADLKGQISVMKLVSGLPVSKASAVLSNQFRLADSPFEVVSIPVDPVSAVGGQIRIGQRVNLYQMVKESSSNSEQASTETDSDIQVTLIASRVLVVDVRTSQGVTAGPGNEEGKSNDGLSSGGKQVEQVQILTLALLPEQVQTVLDAVAASKKEGGLLWTTLAVP